MTPRDHTTTLAAFALAGLILVCTSGLVAFDKLDSSLYIGSIVAPLVGAVAGVVGYAAGTRAGAQSVVSPPPDA